MRIMGRPGDPKIREAAERLIQSYGSDVRSRPHLDDKITVTIEIERTYVDNADALTDHARVISRVLSSESLRRILSVVDQYDLIDPFDVSITHTRQRGERSVTADDVTDS